MFRERIRSRLLNWNCEVCGHSLKVEYAWDYEDKSYIPVEFYNSDDLYCSIALDKCPECGGILEM